MFTEKAIAIEWLKNHVNSLKSRLARLDKTIEDYESEKKEILYDIREDEKLLKQLECDNIVPGDIYILIKDYIQ